MITEHQSYNILMNTKVKFIYCDKEGIGTVIDSRVKYGIRKQYSIKLIQPMTFPWQGSDKMAGDVVLIDNTDILEILE